MGKKHIFSGTPSTQLNWLLAGGLPTGSKEPANNQLLQLDEGRLDDEGEDEGDPKGDE